MDTCLVVQLRPLHATTRDSARSNDQVLLTLERFCRRQAARRRFVRIDVEGRLDTAALANHMSDSVCRRHTVVTVPSDPLAPMPGGPGESSPGLPSSMTGPQSQLHSSFSIRIMPTPSTEESTAMQQFTNGTYVHGDSHRPDHGYRCSRV
jgi:hypothetical protein